MLLQERSNALLLIIMWLVLGLGGIVIRSKDSLERVQANIRLLEMLPNMMAHAEDYNGLLDPSLGQCRSQASDRSELSDPNRLANVAEDWPGCSALTRSRLVCQQGSRDDAIRLLDVAREECPRIALVDAWQGDLAWFEGDWQAAIQHWRQTKHGPFMMLMRAVEFLRADDLVNGLRLLDGALADGRIPINTEQLALAYEALGQAYQRRSQWHLAVVAYDEAVNLNSSRSWTWVLLGIANRRTEEWERAETAFSRALALVPPDSTSQLSIIYEQLSIMQEEAGNHAAAYRSLSNAYCLRQEAEENTGESLQSLQRRLSRLASLLDPGSHSSIDCPK